MLTMKDPRCGARPGLQPMLLAGVSGLALLAGGGGAPAQAGAFKSLTQALASARPYSTSSVSGSAAAAQAAIGVQNLTAAAARFNTLSQALAAAGQTGVAGAAVPNGLTVGGLQPAAGYNQAGSTVWQGVSTTSPLTETTSNGATTVTITQTRPQAILNWQSFNVGAATTVSFNQSAGGAAATTWSVLNRVDSPLASPTLILGSIKAQGQVLVLNLNGVLFEAGSQVNLHSLIAGGADITDSQFLTNGIYSPAGSNFVPSFTAQNGSVTVQAGADIVTSPPASVTSGGGFVILLGANAANAGSISTPDGQTILAAGQGFALQPGYSVSQSSSGVVSGNTTLTVLGSQIETTGAGTAANTGLIEATTGDITLAGQTVNQSGVLLSTTSVQQRGTIHLDADPVDSSTGVPPASNPAASVVLAAGSVTEILPDTSATTALNAQQQTGYTAQIAPDGIQDQPGLSRIEITSGGGVDFAGNSLTLAPAGQIAVQTPGGIFVGAGAMLDVSGLTNVTLPMGDNQLAISVEPNNLRDSPLNNAVGGALDSSTIIIDTQQLTVVPATSADPNARAYTAGGLLEVSGEVGNVGHTESEWSTVAGKIYLFGGQVVAQPGSIFNLTGGSTLYQAGTIQQTYLVGANGEIYDANTAPANIQYLGLYTGDTVDHPRWHITDTYENPLLTPAQVNEPSYIVGQDAGSLILSTPTALFEGTIAAGVTYGISQTQAPAANVADPFLNTQQTAPLAGTLTLTNDTAGSSTPTPFATEVVIDSDGGTAASALTATSVLPASLVDTAEFSASQIDGLSGLTIDVAAPLAGRFTAPGIIIRTDLDFASGAQVALSAPLIDVEARISAPGGVISLTNVNTTQPFAQAAITLGAGAALSTAGNFVNALVDPATTGLGAFINGGSITLDSQSSLFLKAGSTIDSSAGALITKSGFTGGKGGSVSLTADLAVTQGARDPQPIFTPLAPITLDATITAYGVTTSGTLSLTVPTVVISAGTTAPVNARADLTPGFFTSGFNAYVIDGFAPKTYTATAAGVTVAAGTQLVVQAPVFVESQSGSSAPTGAPGQGLVLYLPPQYLLNESKTSVTQRTGASLTLTSGAAPFQVSQPTATGAANVTTSNGAPVTIEAGAAISVDPGQNVTLSSLGTIVVDGTITAHSGTIALLNPATSQSVDADQVAETSIWVGPTAVLDASGIAETALDTRGNPFGTVTAGGSIILGATGNFANPANATADDAFIFVRPGALLDASGTRAALYVDSATAAAPTTPGSGTTVLVGSAGGTISFVSASGIYLDGSFVAAAGSAAAAGGTLQLQLDTDEYNQAASPVPAWALSAHEIIISAQTASTPLPATLQPGDTSFLDGAGPDSAGIAGKAAISQAQIDAGGFSRLALLARDEIVFDGDVTLHAAQSISLTAFSLSENSLTGTVSIAAPYVLLSSSTGLANPLAGQSTEITPLLNGGGGLSYSQNHLPCISGAAACSAATLTVTADLIDIENQVAFGAHGTITDNALPFGGQAISAEIDNPGFNAVDLVSSGDIRFAADSGPVDGTTAANGLTRQPVSLVSAGDITLSAARIYPETGVAATIIAGGDFLPVVVYRGQNPVTISSPNTTLFPDGVLTIENPGQTASQAPLSAFGSLTLGATVIDDSGTLYAPLGSVLLEANAVNLSAGSTVSVSAAGETIPFGGTTDGLTYSYNGEVLTFDPASYGATLHYGNQDIAISATTIDVAAGSMLNASGGGTLSGGGGEINSGNGSLTSQGFIPGSTGSTDILYTTFLSFNATAHSATQTQAATNALSGTGIYAILPGNAAAYAPATLLDAQSTYAGSVPTPGEQVTIGGDVPGLAAGTYTLLPSYYALLPGAYRVQFAQGTTTAQPVQTQSPDGLTTVTNGYLGIANTAVLNVMPTTILFTPGSDLTRYAQYDTQDYAATAIAAAAVFGAPRPYLPQDAGSLLFNFPSLSGTLSPTAQPQLALQFSGTADLLPAAGGYGGAVEITSGDLGGENTPALPIDILAGGAPKAGTVSIAATSLDALDAPLLEIGGAFGSPLSNADILEDVSPGYANITVSSGATLTGGAVWLFSQSGATNNAPSGQITIQPGAVISTLGTTVSLPDSSSGVIFQTAGAAFYDQQQTATEAVVGVANGTYNFLTPNGLTGQGGNVTIGTVPAQGAATPAPVTLYSDGVIGVFAGASLSIATNTVIGAKAVAVGAPEINVGTVPAGAGSVPGIDLTQATLDALLNGNAAVGAPALASLTLTASNSLNFYGTVLLNTQSSVGTAGLQTLVLNTPAIYGTGNSDDVATLDVANLQWNGSTGAPGPVVPNGPGTGAGTLVINAQTVTLGYGADDQAQDQTNVARTILGFANVDITATRFITGNNQSSLSVYQSQGAYQSGTGYSDTGGALTLSTPLLTTAPGAVLGFTAGGAVMLDQPVTTATGSLTAPSGLGGEIQVTGSAITASTAVVLPSGALVLNAANDISLTGAKIDLSGRAVGFFDLTENSWGGTLSAESAHGNITLDALSSIDISATGTYAGTIDLTATSGTVALLGSISGSASAGSAAGSIAIRAASLGDLTTLDTSLDAGGVFGSRSFEQTGPGDITVGSELQAQSIAVSVDQGSLTVDGTLNASGAAPGTISLAAATGLTLSAGAVLDAHGTTLQTDSTGAPIDADNTAHINLTVLTAPATPGPQGTLVAPQNGTLTIDSGASFDLASPDGAARGDIEINVPRASEAGGGANISAAGPIAISGAGTIAVNAFWTYTPDNSPGALAGGVVTQASLGVFAAASTSFIDAALQMGLVTGPLAGLSAYSSAFHLRPGVQVESSANVAGGDLTLQGDIDLSGYRYASVDPATAQTSVYGSGEPGVLWLRASNTLHVYGSLTDGFAPPPATPDDDGWVLHAGVAPSGQTIVLTAPVTLAGSGGPNGATTYPVGDYALSYAVTIADGATMNANAPAPATVALTQPVTAGSNFIVTGTLTLPGGLVLQAGQTVAEGTVLAAGTLLAPGTTLPFPVQIGGVGGAAGIALAAGTNFGIFADSSETIVGTLSLQAGDMIPGFANIQFTSAGTTSVDTRTPETVNGASVLGQLWGAAPLLPAGDLSWSLRLVSGANLGAADSTQVQAASALAGDASATMPDPGSLVLSDTHYADALTRTGRTSALAVGTVPDFSVLRTGTGSLDLISGGSIDEASLFGVYTAGTQSPGIVAGGVYDQPRPVTGGSVLGVSGNLPGANGATYNGAIADYQANYPLGGGNLLVSAQGNVVGDTYNAPLAISNNTSQYIWWQGSSTTPSAWWINYGTFADNSTASGAVVSLVGFTGFGTLGGGNVTISAGGQAGTVAGVITSSTAANPATSGAVNATVASTGRADPTAGTIALTGGGDLTITVAGAVNPQTQQVSDPDFGVETDMRGQIAISAQSVGTVTETYANASTVDPRPGSIVVSETFLGQGGLDLSLGDANAQIDTRADQQLGQVGDPTTGVQIELANQSGAATTYFSLWQPTTTVNLASLGGNITPLSPQVTNSLLYPPNLNVTAYSGSILISSFLNISSPTLELAPSPQGQLQFLAGTSIIDTVDLGSNGGAVTQPTTIEISGSPVAAGDLATPLTPSDHGQSYFSLEPNGIDTASGLLQQGNTTPARFYAVSGDILGLLTGQPGIYAKAVDIRAGTDVVKLNANVLNNNASDISTIQAGQDIIYGTENIAGPGLLLVQAGRNVYQGDQGVLTSIGEIGLALTQATRNDGAGITVLAGVGAGGPPLVTFADLYLSAANLADPTIPLQSQTGKVERTYQTQLLAYLQTEFGYTGTAAGALAFFLALPADQQTAFLLSVYFAELNQSGLDYNNPSSRFYHSYLEGQEAIETLFPATDTTGKSAPDGGSLTLFSGGPLNSSGQATLNGSIRTLFGGAITALVPFGQTSFGNYGLPPGPSAGVLTEGSGDIDLYSYGSVTLGQSRVLTTFGGNILIWMSSDGEINAGRGSKSTVLSTPIGISYDLYGNVTLSPTVPSSGAGIGTLSPIPDVEAGDVNLIAPVGTIDAGEAGIRASGNANIVALTLLNGNNVAVGGKTTGAPTVTGPSAAAAAAASSAAGASTAAAQQERTESTPTPSVIEVEILGVTDTGTDEEKKRRKHREGAQSSNDTGTLANQRKI